MQSYVCAIVATVALSLQALSSAWAEPVEPTHYPKLRSTTELSEVQRGNVDGHEYLTIHINGAPTGPAECRSTVLKVDAGSAFGPAFQNSIEAVALSAMLNQQPVTITVPLDPAQCHAGRPTFTGLDMASRSMPRSLPLKTTSKPAR